MRGLQRKTGQLLRQLDAAQTSLASHAELTTSSVTNERLLTRPRYEDGNALPTSAFEQGRKASGFLSMLAGLAVLGYTQQRMQSNVAYADTAEEGSKLQAEDEELAKYRRVRQKRGLPNEIILYQYEVCPFCNKVRAFLDYHNLPYRVVEVNPLTKSQIKWSEYKKVPVVMLDEEVVNDSSLILSRLACEFEQEKPAEQQKKGWFSSSKDPPQSSGTADEDEEIRWRKWVDKTFVQLITVNIYRTPRESWQTFDYITSHGNFNFFERQAARVSGSGLMYGISGRLIKKYGIKGDLREALYTAANEWVDNLGSKPFRGGEKPDLSDLSLFGVIRSVTGTDTFQDLMHKSQIAAWYERMMAEVGTSSRLPERA